MATWKAGSTFSSACMTRSHRDVENVRITLTLTNLV